jgi:spermidine synthase
MPELEGSKKSLALELFLLSFASLFFEMIVIRWLSCDFVTFMVFKTFPLVTCFVGLGVGISKGKDDLFRMLGPSLFLFVLTAFSCSLAGLGSITFPAIGVYQWSDPSSGALMWFQVFRMILLIVLLLAGPFAVMVCLGSRIGVLFNQQKPLDAYCIDIAGAITGSLCFALASFLGMAPSAQVIVVALLVLFFSRHLPRPAFILSTVTLLAAMGIAFIPSFGEAKIVWSPYARIELNEVKVPVSFLDTSASGSSALSSTPGSPGTPGTSGTSLVGILLNANHGFQQIFTLDNKIDLTDEGKKQEALNGLSHFLDVRHHYYGLPYMVKTPETVLVLGAGTGSDVREALKHGAQHVDAVEIDPQVAQIGRRYNPDYSSPKVNVIVDDARNFVNKASAKRYDMVVLACLDSLAFSGTGSSMRTDSYIHTRQSYVNCLKMLKPDGIFVVSFGAPVVGHGAWLRDKICATLESASGYRPLVLTDLDSPYQWPAFVFISGEPVRAGKINPPAIPDSFHPVSVPEKLESKVLSDDWPYLYIRPIGIDLSYLSVVFVVVGITVFAARQLIFARNSASDGQLFALGAAFMLLELQAISRLSLLYGTTWVTTSVVINGVLLMILAANFLVLKFASSFNQKLLYAFLAVSLASSYFLPVTDLLASDSAGSYIGHAAVTIISLSPVFAAGLLFATSFRSVQNPARSFAFNLLGSVVGALLEYLSTYWGVQSLLLVAFVLYSISFAFFLRDQKTLPAES